VRVGGSTRARRLHEDQSDYSGWLLRAVDGVLAEAGLRIEEVELIGVATGPGSFTGLRVGLTTVKAWAEVYGTKVVGVSRLETVARSAAERAVGEFVAASYDAQRGHVFGALFRKGTGLERIGLEVVVAPEEFVELVNREAGNAAVGWVSLDPELLKSVAGMERRVAAGDTIVAGTMELASTIGMIAEERAAAGLLSDPLALDANYVRRSDAEILWKESSSCGR
jgi:tRNA threonylcarbamoyladenosine biosynthesis protein TsaB